MAMLIGCLTAVGIVPCVYAIYLPYSCYFGEREQSLGDFSGHLRRMYSMNFAAIPNFTVKLFSIVARSVLVTAPVTDLNPVSDQFGGYVSAVRSTKYGGLMTSSL